MPSPIPPDAALFLDIDGTLLDIAAKPHLVTIPEALPATLASLRHRLHGAVAFISGRPLAEIDQFFPGQFCAAAEHGAVLRDGQGALHHITQRPAAYEHWRRALEAAAREHPGVLIELKTVGIVAHFRQAPGAGPAIERIAQSLIAESGPDNVLLPAHMAYELRPKGAAKDTALAWFMARPPFAGRRPIFIGDDVTDEPAIALATASGGTGLHVARDFGASPAAVRQWLAMSAGE